MFKFSGYTPPAQGSPSIEVIQLSFLNARAARFSKIEAVFFLMNSLCGLKANGPFSAKSWPGTLWKLKFAILSLQITILKQQIDHFEAKIDSFEPKTDHFEPKIADFEAKIAHFAVENGHFETF